MVITLPPSRFSRNTRFRWKIEDGTDLLILKQDKKTEIKGHGKGLKALTQPSGYSLSPAESRIPVQLTTFAGNIAYTGTIMLFYRMLK